MLAGGTKQGHKRWDSDGEPPGPSLLGWVGRVGMMHVRGLRKWCNGGDDTDEILHGPLDAHDMVPHV